MGQDQSPAPFECHPECLKRSYWRRVFLEVEEDISGLRPGRLIELVIAVENAEAAWCLASKFKEWHDHPVPRTRVGQSAAIELWLRGWAEWTIDATFGFPHGATDRILAESRLHRRAQEVVFAHLDGHPPSRISRDLRVARKTIDGILERIGEEPHEVRNRAASAVTNHAVISLYEDLRRSGSKNIYAQIASRLGISESSVRSRLQYARKKGKITDPPLARSNMKRRRGAAE